MYVFLMLIFDYQNIISPPWPEVHHDVHISLYFSSPGRAAVGCASFPGPCRRSGPFDDRLRRGTGFDRFYPRDARPPAPCPPAHRHPLEPPDTEFEGVLIRDLLATADLSGTEIDVQAINDYSARIPVTDLERYDIRLVDRIDGEFLRVRDKRPLWVIYPLDQHPSRTAGGRHRSQDGLAGPADKSVMKLTRPALHLGLLCALVLIFFGAAVAAAYRLHAERAALDSSLRVGAWSATEAERELLTLYGMALRHSIDPAAVSKDDGSACWSRLRRAGGQGAVENMGGRVILKPVPIAELVRTVAALGKVPA
jgi:hypothetical protein